MGSIPPVTPSVASDDSTNYDEDNGCHILRQKDVVIQNETIITPKKRKCNDGNRIPTAQSVPKKERPRKTKMTCTKKVETNKEKNLPGYIIHEDEQMGPYYVVKNCSKKHDSKEFRLYIEPPPPEVIGTLKSWEGKQPISFQNCSFLAYNPDIGRVYYDGFEWNNKKFMVGDPIFITTDLVKVRKMATIVCCYLATKSFEETVNEEPENVQERGYPYMGLWIDQRRLKHEVSIKFGTKKIEHPPEWLQQTSLKIYKRGRKSQHTKDDRLKQLLNNASHFQWDNNLIITQSPDVENEVDLEKIHESEYDSIQEESDDDDDEVEARTMLNELGKKNKSKTLQEFIQGERMINNEKQSNDACNDEQSERGDDCFKGSKFESKECMSVTIGDEMSDISSMKTSNDDNNGPYREVTRGVDRFCLYLNKPSTYKVGKLIPWGNINFSWIEDSFVAYNKDLGRVYYGSFILNGRQFSMGEIARIHTKDIGTRNAMIISCYQATKSYKYFEKKEQEEQTPQDRGYPYMEIQYVDTSKKNHSITDCDKAEFPPDWMQSKSLKMEKISHLIEFTNNKLETMHECRLELLSRAASFQWPEEHNVNEVDALKLEEEGDDDDDDDDDTSEFIDCDVNDFYDGQQDKKSGIQVACNTKIRIKNLIDNMIKDNNWNKGDIEKLQLVGHDKDWESKLLGSDQIPTEELELLKEVFESSRSSKSAIDKNYSLADALYSQLQASIKSQQPLNEIAKVIPENDFQADTYRDARIEAERKKLGYPKLERRFLQVISDLISEVFEKDAIRTIGPKHDILLQAPCGYGKSCCFAIASQILGGITLIIEPLRALIDSQVTELKGRGVCVEKLLPRKDATTNELTAVKRLEHLLLTRTNAKKHEPLVLIMTPELFQSVKYLIREFVRRRLISLIVVDEFDEIQNAKLSYRESYLTLMQELRHAAPNVQLFLLSATVTKKLIVDLNNSFNNSFNQMFPNDKITAMPCLYRTGSPLPTNHIYRVERKINEEQVVEDVVKEIKDEMCLCYCLAPACCIRMKVLFEKHKVNVDCYYSDQDDNEKERVLNRFKNGTLQVLCATKALGRGVHLGKCPIRFVIHTTMPLSLADYIQETGRGGRDGLPTSCIFFYRDQDKTAAKNVLRSHGQLDLEQEIRLRGVCMYALEGNVCRNKMLSTVAVDEACSGQSCFNRSCDNCKMKLSDEHQPVNKMIIDLIKSESNIDLGADNTAPLLQSGISLLKTYSIDNKFLMCGFLHYRKRRKTMLLDYLQRLIGSHGKMSFQQRIESSRVSFFLRSKARPARKLNAILPDPKVGIASKVLEVYKFTPKRVKNPDRLPYLIQFELQRLNMWNSSDTEFYNDLKRLCHQDEISAWKLLYQKQKLVMPLQNRIAEWERSPEQMKLFFSCSLSKTGLPLKLNQPGSAFDRRIYRCYGSHRFLEISVEQETRLDIIKKIFIDGLDFCGRKFRFLWTKLNKSSQVFVLFAESGVGIHPKEACSVLKLRETCIPRNLNSDLTISQYFKRMKLWFSTTKQGFVLENGSLDIVSDFNCHGMKEIDGAGLVSQALLERLKDEYKKNCNKNDVDLDLMSCTGFQGRIGGHKGVWNLDPSLGTEKIKVRCRSSQIKYNSLLSEDPWQNTVEISGWNGKLPANLNTRTIQILEYLASKVGKEAGFKEFCNDCMAQSINQLEELCSDESNELLKEMTRRNKRNFKNQVETDYEKNDTSMLFEMGAAGIDSTDPTFARSKKRLIEKLFRGIIEGARYPIKDSCSLRMVPDHTLLLDEGEVFLALDGQPTPIKEVIAMRSPAYFASDIRRLKVVDLDTLTRRYIERQSNPSMDIFARIPQDLQITLEEQINFFKRIRFSFVISSFGVTNEADKMSGGDYDGDNAWICWNEKLLACLPAQSQDPLPKTDKVVKPPKYEICVWDATLDSLLEYSRHFRHHQGDLGQYANLLDVCIDMHGFEHPWSIELGWGSFFQVDHPYNNPRGSPRSLCMELKEELAQIPHWKQHKKSGNQEVYQSKSVLGEMYSIMNDKLQKLNEKIVHGGIKLPPGIEEKLKQCKLDIMTQLIALREDMTRKILAYLDEKKKKFPNPFITEEMKTKFYNWQFHYCDEVSSKLLTNKIQRIGNAEKAAILYEQCRWIHAEHPDTNATEFAWAVAKNELVTLVAADGGLHISKKMKNVVLSC